MDMVGFDILAVDSDRKTDVDVVTLGIRSQGILSLCIVTTNVNVVSGYGVTRGFLTVTHLITRYNSNHNKYGEESKM